MLITIHASDIDPKTEISIIRDYKDIPLALEISEKYPTAGINLYIANKIIPLKPIG